MKKLFLAIMMMLSLTVSAQDRDSATVPTKVTVEKSDNQILKEDKKQEIRSDIRKRRTQRKAEMKKARKTVEKRVERDERTIAQ